MIINTATIFTFQTNQQSQFKNGLKNSVDYVQIGLDWIWIRSRIIDKFESHFCKVNEFEFEFRFCKVDEFDFECLN